MVGFEEDTASPKMRFSECQARGELLEAENERLKTELASLQAAMARIHVTLPEFNVSLLPKGARIARRISSCQKPHGKGAVPGAHATPHSDCHEAREDPGTEDTGVPRLQGSEPPAAQRLERLHSAELSFEKAVLAGTLVCMVLIWGLPLVRPFRKCCETRIYKIYPIITLLNLIAFFIVLQSLPLISVNMVFFWGVTFVEVVIDKLEEALIGLAGLAALIVMWKFKDRILEALGVEGAHRIIGEFRDWATCWSMKRFQAIELFIWKVEGLPAAKVHAANDIFCEVALGYNVRMRTRVHHRAGHKCVFRESMQLNFDPIDTDQRLCITVMNQEVMSSTDIARVHLGVRQVDSLRDLAAREHDQRLGWGVTTSFAETAVWASSRFHKVDLLPSGTLYLCFAPVDLDEGRGCCSDCWCWWPAPRSDSARQQDQLLSNAH